MVALALLALGGAVARADPGAHEGRDPGPGGRSAAVEASSEPRAAEPPPEPMPERPGRTPSIEHPEALASFFESLARTAAGDGITRVTHLGDSSIGTDGIPHALRRRFQAELGDAGPGFVLLQAHTHSYVNRTVQIRIRAHWSLCYIIHRCRHDGRYGLGGVTVESRGAASTLIRPRSPRVVSRAEVWYLAQPDGGRLEARFGDRAVTVDTAAEQPEDRTLVIEREPGEHPLRVTARGRVRAYGVVLENEGPGVVWDTLSMRGALTPRLLEQDRTHFAGQLVRRDPDLVVLSYGGNDLARIVRGDIAGDDLREETYRVIARIRAAVPRASCLVVGIGDHLRSGASIVRPRHVEAVLAAQRAAASQGGCAFWDTTAAMGGTRTYARWRRERLATSDGRHLAEAGRRVIAARLYAALAHARRATEDGSPTSADDDLRSTLAVGRAEETELTD